MKNNEKVMSYIESGKISKIKSPHPAYEILKPLMAYIRSVWGCKRGAGCVLRDFLSFSIPKYHFTIKELKCQLYV